MSAGGHMNGQSSMPEEISDLVERFEQAWEGAEPPSIAGFLANLAEEKSDESFWRRLVRELVGVDLDHRWRRHGGGEQETATYRPGSADGAADLPRLPRLEDYLDRFPELGSGENIPLELVVSEFRARHHWGDRPPVEGYAARFAHLHGQLEEALSQVLAEVTPLTLRVYCHRHLAYVTHMATAVEIGRQQSGEPPPFSESVMGDRVRLVIAPLEEKKISRRHVYIERVKRGVVRVTSLTAKGDIGVDHVRLPPGGCAEAELPVLLVLGQYAMRLEAKSN